MSDRFFDRAFWAAFGLNFVWMNLSETVRYFYVVKPLVRASFGMVPGIVPDTPLIAILWAVWDTILILVTTIIGRLVIERFGLGIAASVSAATLVWTTVFVLLWLGDHNMGLATPQILASALPLAWFELVVAVLIVRSRVRSAPRTAAAVAAQPVR